MVLKRIANAIKRWDASWLLNNASGWDDADAGVETKATGIMTYDRTQI